MTMMAAAAWREGEESPASGGEEADDEDDEGGWEYDSTWDEEDEAEGEPERAEAAAADPEEAEHSRTLQPSLCRPPIHARWTPGSQEQQRPHFSFGFRRFKSTRRRNWAAARDMQRYRRHYPGLEETDTEAREEEMWNLSFYKNEIRFLPRGLYIDELLDAWQNDYGTLEQNHSYIQWLFPLREQGMNWRAKLLTCREIQAFRKSKEVMNRFIRVYKLMLGFYGIDLINKETGELRRAENWRERFHNLNLYTHNNLRITRILKCLGELGYEHYQVHLVKFFLTETLVHQTLPRVRESALDYFMFTVRNKQKRRELIYFAWQHFDQKQEFVWGPRKKLLKFKPRSPEFQSNLKLEEEQEATTEGVGDAEGKSQTKPPNETCVVGHAGNSTESQVKPLSELEASEKMSEPRPASAAEEEAKGCCGSVYTPVSFLELESEGLAGESESSRGGADGESLKESKKRKLEMNKLSEERATSSKSPTDIESISCNLEEVVIDKEGPNCHPEAEEASEPLAPEGGDTKGVKDAELVNAKVKRRKVDEIASKDCASEKTGKAGAEVTSFQGRVTNCTVPSIERAYGVCQEEVKAIDTSVEVPADCRTLGVRLSLSSGNTVEPDAPSDVSVPDKVDGQGIASSAEGEGSQPYEGLKASKKEEGGGTGQVEGDEDAAGERKRPTQKPEVKELHPKQD